jgi:hemerythrin-like domain-containing protein
MIDKIRTQSSKMLAREHENILKVADALERESEVIEKGKEIDEEFFRSVIEFIRNYADKFHHAKEEDILFKEFMKKVESDEGCVHCNPVEQMLIEHDEGRAATKLMEEGVNENVKDKVLKGARGYVGLIRDHIFKEDNILYPMTDGVLGDEIEREMLGKFEKIGEERRDEEEKYVKFVEGLDG